MVCSLGLLLPDCVCEEELVRVHLIPPRRRRTQRTSTARPPAVPSYREALCPCPSSAEQSVVSPSLSLSFRLFPSLFVRSGRLPIHVNQVNHPPDYPGGGVPLGMTILPEVLARAGYASHQVRAMLGWPLGLRPDACAPQIGKWHCGMSSVARLPVNRGFNSSFG